MGDLISHRHTASRIQGLKGPFPLQLKESLGQFFDKGPGGTVTASQKLVNIMESLI